MRAEIGCGLRPATLDSTTNTGRSSASLPSPSVTHDPTDGRPLRAVPVFIIVWAGSWLIWSVTIDLTTQISSAIFAAYGRKSPTQVPPLPYCLNLVSGPWTL